MSVWVEARSQVGHSLTRVGGVITRLGDRVEGAGSWTGDHEVAWREGYDFARDKEGLKAMGSGD